MTLAFARQSKEQGSAALGNALVGGALAGWTIMFLRITVTAIVITLLSHTIVRFGMGVVLGGSVLRARLLVATGVILAVGAASLIFAP